jgi:aminotransferase
MLALLDPGDEVLVPDPFYLNYLNCMRLAEARAVRIPLGEENGFQVAPSDLEQAITPKTKMIITNSPHNPTGAVLDKETIEAIAQVAIEHDLLVLSDEIYEKLIYDGTKHHSIASLPGMAERTVTVNGFSKAYSMTGWRLGYIAAHKHLIDPLIRAHQYIGTSANSFAQKGAVAAYRGPQDCVQEMVTEFDRRRKFLVEALKQIDGVSCIRPQGAFYAFPSVKELGVPDEKLAYYLLREARVALVPGSTFGECGQGHLRLSYANSYENIQAAVDRTDLGVGQILGSLPAQGPKHVIHNGKAHAPPSLLSEAGHVRGKHHLLELKEGIIRGGRLWIVYVQPHPTEVPIPQSLDQCRLVYHRAPGSVDQNPLWFHSTDNGLVDQVTWSTR